MVAKQRYAYRAGKHVVLGVANEHAYNMFLSIWQMHIRLGLWDTAIPEQRLYEAWQRMVRPMKLGYVTKKTGIAALLRANIPYALPD
jgi:hypothetical protein